MTTIIILMALFLMYYSLKQYRRYNDRKFELRLFALRDKLRDYVIEDKISKNDWTFTYLDSSISKMTKTFKKINIFHAVYLSRSHADDHKLELFVRHLDSAFKRNENFKELYTEYTQLLKVYVFYKHLFFLSFAAGAIHTAIVSLKSIAKLRQTVGNSIKSLSVLPETSTSGNFSKKLKLSS